MKVRAISLLLVAVLLLTACNSGKNKNGGRNGDAGNSIADSTESLPDEKLDNVSDYENYKFIKYDTDTTLKSEYFDIIIEKDSIVPEHFEQMCDMVASDVMKITGLKFYTDGNTEKNRMIINVQREHRAQCDPDRNIYLTEGDTNLYNGCSHVLAHELGHMIQWANFGSFGRMLDEGYATYVASRYYNISQLPDLYNIDKTIALYDFPQESDLENELTQKYYIDPYENMMVYYALGLRLNTFIYEKYGEETVNKLYSALNAGKVTDGKQFIKTLKGVTSENFISEFSKWQTENASRINQTDPEIDLTKRTTLYYMPTKYYDVWNTAVKDRYFYELGVINGKIDKEITVDFKKGSDYFRMCENKELKIAGRVQCEKECTVKFYDKDKKLIEVLKTQPGIEKEIKKDGICYMKIEGSGNVKFTPDQYEMIEKDLRKPDNF